MTNDPSAGYWLDGLPYAIDPEPIKHFIYPEMLKAKNLPISTNSVPQKVFYPSVTKKTPLMQNTHGMPS